MCKRLNAATVNFLDSNKKPNLDVSLLFSAWNAVNSLGRLSRLSYRERLKVSIRFSFVPLTAACFVPRM